MHLADTFIQSDLQCIQAIHFFISMCVPWELNPWPFALLTQCSTTEPQEHIIKHTPYILDHFWLLWQKANRLTLLASCWSSVCAFVWQISGSHQCCDLSMDLFCCVSVSEVLFVFYKAQSPAHSVSDTWKFLKFSFPQIQGLTYFFLCWQKNRIRKAFFRETKLIHTKLI